MRTFCIIVSLSALALSANAQSKFGPSSVEIRGTETPYIDISNDAETDFDMRLILNGDDALVIDGGNVGIGDYSPDHKLSIDGNFKVRYDDGVNIVDVKTAWFVSDDLGSARQEGFRVSSSSTDLEKTVYGVIGIANSAGTYFNGNSIDGEPTAIGIYGRAHSPYMGYAGYFDGHLVYTGILASTSDERLKENIREISPSLNLILQLNPSEYTFKSSSQLELPKGIQAGFLANEFKTLFPNLTLNVPAIQPEILGDSLKLHNEELSNFTSINYVGLIPYLVRAIQEQQDMIVRQQEAIDALSRPKSPEHQILTKRLICITWDTFTIS